MDNIVPIPLTERSLSAAASVFCCFIGLRALGCFLLTRLLISSHTGRLSKNKKSSWVGTKFEVVIKFDCGVWSFLIVGIQLCV